MSNVLKETSLLLSSNDVDDIFSLIGGRVTEELVTKESGTGGKERFGQSETQTDGE